MLLLISQEYIQKSNHCLISTRVKSIHILLIGLDFTSFALFKILFIKVRCCMLICVKKNYVTKNLHGSKGFAFCKHLFLPLCNKQRVVY